MSQLSDEEIQKLRSIISSFDGGKTVDQLQSATSISGSENMAISVSGVSKKISIANIISLVDSGYVGGGATKTVLNSTNASVAVSDKNGNRIDTTYALKSEVSGWVIGDIKLHYGTLSSIGSDWHICDGGTYNGVKTPDMGGAYPIGYKASSAATPTTVTDKSENYGAIGNICGSNTHALTGDENGPHVHKFQVRSSDDDTGGVSNGNASSSGVQFTTDSSGLGTPHENRPYSVVLAFLMKIA